MATKKDTYLISVITAEYWRARNSASECREKGDHEGYRENRENERLALRMAEKAGFDVQRSWFHHGTNAQKKAYMALWRETRREIREEREDF